MLVPRLPVRPPASNADRRGQKWSADDTGGIKKKASGQNYSHVGNQVVHDLGKAFTAILRSEPSLHTQNLYFNAFGRTYEAQRETT